MEVSDGENTTWIALLSMLFGGAGLKIVEKLLDRQESNYDIGQQLREELRSEREYLRDEVNSLRTELERAESDLERLNKKYNKMLLLFYQIKRGEIKDLPDEF